MGINQIGENATVNDWLRYKLLSSNKLACMEDYWIFQFPFHTRAAKYLGDDELGLLFVKKF